VSQRDAALQAIRHVILSGEIPAGHRTSERRLTEEFLAKTGLGRTPVREALAILTQQGIVEQYPQSGFAVRRVDANEAQKVLRLQRITEDLVVAEAARIRIDTGELHGITGQMESVAARGEGSRLLELARSFHISVTRAADYASAVDAIGGFRDRFALFLADTVPLKAQEQLAISSLCRALVTAIREDTNGDRSRKELDELLRTEAGFISARAKVAPAALAMAG
jgi:DNA-binding GntR family transcriptional regulator